MAIQTSLNYSPLAVITDGHQLLTEILWQCNRALVMLRFFLIVSYLNAHCNAHYRLKGVPSIGQRKAESPSAIIPLETSTSREPYSCTRRLTHHWPLTGASFMK